MAAAHSSSLNALFLSLCLLLFGAAHLCLHGYGSAAAGFSAELIHRDSSKSPFHDPASTPSSRLHAFIHRSASRADYLGRTHSHNSNSPIHPPVNDILFTSITNYFSNYLMAVYLGSLKRKILAMVDTGSEVSWMLCDPCHRCYEHKDSVFDSNSSSSYHKLKCYSRSCSFLRRKSCDVNNNCKFSIKYLDGSFVGGILSAETFGLESTAGGIVDLKNIIFGCTRRSQGPFSEYSIGLIGLNRGPLSLVSQLGRSYGRRFSYCLPFFIIKSSRIYFGSAAKVSGPGVVTTPLVQGIKGNSYELILETIRVADEKPIIMRPPPQGVDAAKQGGNIIIDSGTAFTYIDPIAMPPLLHLVKKNTPYPVIKPMTSSKALDIDMHDLDNHFDLCFDVSKAGKNVQMPKITFRFAGGAAVVLRMKNAFMYLDKNTLCLSIMSNDKSGGVSLYGSLAQMDYHIGYDLDAEALSFLPEEFC